MQYEYTPEDLERFWTAIDTSGGTDSCWKWQKSTSARIRVRNSAGAPVQRLSYELAYGEIPAGFWVIQTCANRLCCNPAHLKLASRQDISTLANTPEKFWETVDKSGGPDACWPWKNKPHKSGYGMANIRRVKYPAHRLAYKLAYGEFDETLHVCHKCDKRICCNPSHLFLGTNADNVQDKVSKGRQAKGIVLGKLTDDQVAELRRKYDEGATYKEIGFAFEITPHYARILALRLRR